MISSETPNMSTSRVLQCRQSRDSRGELMNSALVGVASMFAHCKTQDKTLTVVRKIAWSKNGCVAYITPDGAAVHLKVFSRDIETGAWDLGKDVPLDIPQGREQFPFVHLSWSHLGNDIVVVDAAGRVLNFSCAMALDRMQYFKAELAHPEAEADGVVGLHWLALYPYEQKVIHPKPKMGYR